MLELKYKKVDKETEKAQLIEFNNNKKVWLPKKCFRICNENIIMIDDWLVAKNFDASFEEAFIGFEWEQLKNAYNSYVERGYKMPEKTITIHTRVITYPCGKNRIYDHIKDEIDKMFLDYTQLEYEDFYGNLLPEDDL